MLAVARAATATNRRMRRRKISLLFFLVYGAGARSDSCLLEIELQELRARDGVETVGRDLAEAERLVERPRRVHRRQCIEPHPQVAACPRVSDRRLRERPAETATARRRPDVEALQLARFPVDAAQRDAALCVEQHQLVEPERVGQLGIEILEREIDIQLGGVLPKQRLYPLHSMRTGVRELATCLSRRAS